MGAQFGQIEGLDILLRQFTFVWLLRWIDRVPVLIALPGLLHLNYPQHVNCGEGSDRANVAVRLAFM